MPPPPPPVTNGTGGRQVTTEFRIVRTTGEVDAFEELAGPAGQPKETKKKVQENILTDFSFGNFTKKKLLEYLYPGDFTTNFEVFRVEFETTFPQAKPPTKGEVWRFMGMLIGATQFTQRGRELFRQTSYAGLRGHPNYARFMSEVRFEQFKKVFHFLFADVTRKNSDAWWPIRGGVDGYNANRKNKVRRTRVICVDEAMSAYQPRASKTGGLPHLSFIKRKPRPLGTEFKAAADGTHGIMLWLEIQEGKGKMKTKPLVGALGANAACALRIALGCTEGAI
jgi:hypothetical protein